MRTGRPISGGAVGEPLLPHLRPDLIHRPGDGTSLRESRVPSPPEPSLPPVDPTRLQLPLGPPPWLVAIKVVPSASMRGSTTANLRASATFAFFMPARLATPSAQLFRSDPFTARVRITFAAS